MPEPPVWRSIQYNTLPSYERKRYLVLSLAFPNNVLAFSLANSPKSLGLFSMYANSVNIWYALSLTFVGAFSGSCKLKRLEERP